MIIILFCHYLSFFFNFIYKKKKKNFLNLRIRLVLLGFVLGPVIGCGLIANMYFKDTWGRARPINIQEFGGDKYIYTTIY